MENSPMRGKLQNHITEITVGSTSSLYRQVTGEKLGQRTDRRGREEEIQKTLTANSQSGDEEKIDR
jgi:hypothetical protein